MNEKAAKPATVRQNDDKSWSYLHPETGEWTGQHVNRDDARKARANEVQTLTPAKSKKSKKTEANVEQSSSNEQSTQIEENAPAKKDVDSGAPVHVESTTSTSTTSEATSNNNQGDVAQQEKSVMSTVTLTLDPKTRKSTSLVFKLPAGVRGSVRIAKTAFPGGVAPTSLSLQSDAENAFAQPKTAMTKEERKAARANAPKLTPEQKLAKLNERAAKLQEKIAKQAAAPAAAPAAAGASA